MQALTNRFCIALLGTYIEKGKALTDCDLFANSSIGWTCIPAAFLIGLGQTIFYPWLPRSTFNTRRVWGILITRYILL